MKSDKEYIEEIIKQYNQRYKKAVLFTILSIAFGVLTYVIYINSYTKFSELTSSIASLFFEGQNLTETDLDLIKLNNELSHSIGIRIGFILSSFVTATGVSLGCAIYQYFGSRKERIIYELYEKTKI